MLKAQEKSNPESLVKQKLEHGHEIVPFPRVVGKLLTALRDPDSNSNTYSSIIETDVALGSRLLKLANSPLLGLSNEVRSIGHATTILGNSRLKNLALTFAGATVFKSGAQNRHLEQLWEHSLGCATTARILAKYVPGVDKDEAFLAGIFHDVGKLFLHDVASEQYIQMVGSTWGRDLVTQEQQTFGVTHQEIGIKLANTWQLPEQIMVSVGYHHNPETAIAHVNLAALVHIADNLARAAGIGSSADNDIDAPNGFGEGLDEKVFEAVMEEASASFEETKSSFA